MQTEIIESVVRLSKDLREAAKTMSDTEARFLVDGYYLLQDQRIRVDGQIRSMQDEPSLLLNWISAQSHILEAQTKAALDRYSKHHRLGTWLRSVVGIGEVLASGYLAHIDIERAPTAGHIFAFAGLDATDVWHGTKVIEEALKEARVGKGTGKVTLDQLYRAAEILDTPAERFVRRGANGPMTFEAVKSRLARRPWNAGLKVITWKTGESFVKTAGRPNSVYGPLYVQRKAVETAKNEAGDFADQALAVLKKKRISKATDAYKWYSGEWTRNPSFNPESAPELPLRPMLPPAHIHARAKRWAVKIFISNLHEVWYEQHYGTPAPAPYPFAYLGHVHKINP